MSGLHTRKVLACRLQLNHGAYVGINNGMDLWGKWKIQGIGPFIRLYTVLEIGTVLLGIGNYENALQLFV